jgi:hypothetical protein
MTPFSSGSDKREGEDEDEGYIDAIISDDEGVHLCGR